MFTFDLLTTSFIYQKKILSEKGTQKGKQGFVSNLIQWVLVRANETLIIIQLWNLTGCKSPPQACDPVNDSSGNHSTLKKMNQIRPNIVSVFEATQFQSQCLLCGFNCIIESQNLLWGFDSKRCMTWHFYTNPHTYNPLSLKLVEAKKPEDCECS